jgi:hypothetical protein
MGLGCGRAGRGGGSGGEGREEFNSISDPRLLQSLQVTALERERGGREGGREEGRRRRYGA